MPDWAIKINDELFRFVTRGVPREQTQVFAFVGMLVGVVLALWAGRIVARESGGKRRLNWPTRLIVLAAPAILFPALVYAVMHGRCQWLTEGGSIDWAQWRMPYSFLLMSLLIVATVIDFDQYLIPDDITVTGMLLGVAWGTLFGNMHLVPLWIDWNDLHPITGPYIPEWIKLHSHWHGFLGSLAGLVTGAAVTWLARIIAHVVLGVEALGFGDVMLMGMIGSFLGWQPVLLVFLLAPIFGLVISITLKLLHGRRAVPYGPYLALGAVLVLFTWKWLWIPTRELFGHGPTLAGLGGLILVTFATLLGMVRLYRLIPVERRSARDQERSHHSPSDEPTGVPALPDESPAPDSDASRMHESHDLTTPPETG